MHRVQVHERSVHRSGVVEASFLEVILGEICVDLISVAGLPVFLEILLEHARAAEVVDAQADHAEGVGYPVGLAFFLVTVEHVSVHLAMIEHGEKVAQRLFVERPLV